LLEVAVSRPASVVVRDLLPEEAQRLRRISRQSKVFALRPARPERLTLVITEHQIGRRPATSCSSRAASSDRVSIVHAQHRPGSAPDAEAGDADHHGDDPGEEPAPPPRRVTDADDDQRPSEGRECGTPRHSFSRRLLTCWKVRTESEGTKDGHEGGSSCMQPLVK
jgi:hypothetical protein